MARFEKELTEARDRNTEYLEALQSIEGRRSVFEDLISTLEDDVVPAGRADCRSCESNLTRHTGHEGELESELRERDRSDRGSRQTSECPDRRPGAARRAAHRRRASSRRPAAEHQCTQRHTGRAQRPREGAGRNVSSSTRSLPRNCAASWSGPRPSVHNSWRVLRLWKPR